MEEKRVDRRVVKTKRAIYSAFAELLSNRDIDDITIRDIVDIADINRKTFYNYYSGIYDLLDEVENSIVRTFETTLSEIDFRKAANDPYPLFEKLTSIINNDLDFYGNLISMKSNTNLITKLVGLMIEKTKEAVITQFQEVNQKTDIILNFVFSGMLSVYRNWFLSDRRQSIEEISAIISSLCSGGISSIIAVDNGNST